MKELTQTEVENSLLGRCKHWQKKTPGCSECHFMIV